MKARAQHAEHHSLALVSHLFHNPKDPKSTLQIQAIEVKK